MGDARIEMCHQCGKHGHIILADGFVGMEFCFETHAVDIVRKGVGEFHCISFQDAMQLVYSIEALKIPHDWHGIPITYLWLVQQWNTFWVEHRYFHPDGCHAFLQQPIEVRDIPPDFLLSFQGSDAA